ncbi:MAG: hypothetical protein NVSMB19_00020 [Vulcanimicrobiaceae bacterium]
MAALRGYRLLDTAAEPAFDSFVKLAAQICDTPIALVSLVDSSRQWFKANVGLPGVSETPRDIAFCAHAILADDILEVTDTLLDPRFVSNAMVTGEPHFRFYAGMPLIDRGGHAIGTLCTLDREPRSLSIKQRDALRHLAASLVTLIETRRGVSEQSLESFALLSEALEHASDAIAILSVSDPHRAPIMAYVNRSFAQFFGYPPAELIGKTPLVLAGPKTDKAKLARLQAAADTRQPGSEILYAYTATGAARLVEARDRAIDATHRVLNIRDLTRIHATQDALTATSQRLQSLLTNNIDCVLTVDVRGNCLDANIAATELFGYAREELLGTGFRELADRGLFPDNETFPETLQLGRPVKFLTVYRHRDGTTRDVECKAVPIVVRGATEGAYVVARDVTRSLDLARLVAQQAERTHALYLISADKESANPRQIEAVLELVLKVFGMQYAFVGEVSGGLIHMRNVVGDGVVLEAGSAIALKHTHVRETIAFGDVLTIADLASPENAREGAPNYRDWHGYISAPLVVEGRTYGALGFLSRRIGVFDDLDRDFVRLVASLISSTLERQLQKKQLNRLAYHDVLTGLTNRAKFGGDLEAAIAQSRRQHRSFAVHFVDLDGFKDVNDTLGHAVGDQVLQECAKRLQQVCRLYDVPARLGGDEFVVLQAEIGDPSHAKVLGDRIVKVLAEPYLVCGTPFRLSASVGISIYPDDGHDAKTLLQHADDALYRAKANGKNRIEFCGGVNAGH